MESSGGSGDGAVVRGGGAEMAAEDTLGLGTVTTGFDGTSGTGSTSGATGGSESAIARSAAGSRERQASSTTARPAKHKRCNGERNAIS